MQEPQEILQYRQSVPRRIPSYIRVIQFMLYACVLLFTVIGSMLGFLWGALAIGTLFFSWYFMGSVRVTYEYKLEGHTLEVNRVSGMRSRPKVEEFLTLDLTRLRIAADENAEALDEFEAQSAAAVPKRVTYDVSAHDAALGCAVAYAMGAGRDEGRWVKVYFQPTGGLCSCLRALCPGKVFIHANEV